MKKLVCMVLSSIMVWGSASSIFAGTSHVVKKGDTLWGISKMYGVDYLEVAKNNNILNPDRIYPGQVIEINKDNNQAVVENKPVVESSPVVVETQEDVISTDINVADYIDTKFSQEVVEKLASLGDNEDVGNRSAGSKAEKEAADYLYNTMKEIGLTNVTEDKFTCDTWSFEKGRLYVSDDEFIALGGYATQLVSDMEELQIVYAGRGTAADYEGLDVKDKLVLIEIDQHNEWWINHPAYQAYLKGAKAVIAYNYAGYAQYDDTTIGVQDICGPDYAPALAIHKVGYDTLRNLIDENGGEATVKLDVKSVVEKNGTSQNVWGEIPGKTDETILLMAHYDGYFHSAFDDATGVATAMSLAKTIIDSGYTPEKTIRVVFHGAEEWGVSGVEYDWAKGAFEQITKIRPEWAEETFVLVNFDGMYPLQGQKDFAIRTVAELQQFTQEAAKSVIDKYPQYNVSVLSPTATGTEDFTYSQNGVAAIVAADVEFENSRYTSGIYHTSKDSLEYGINDEVFNMVHEIFAQIIVKLDQTEVRPMNFTASFEGLKESLDTELIPADSPVFELLDKAIEVAQVLDKKIQDGEVQDAKEFNKALYEIFLVIRQNFIAFDWETSIIYPTEQCQNNIYALEAAMEALYSGNGDLAYDEYLFDVDYNWYAYDFEKEAYEFQLDRMRNKATGTWGEGLLVRPGENLYDVISYLADNYGVEGVDYSAQIAELNDALKRQYTYLDDLVKEEIEALNTLIASMENLVK